MQNKFYTEFDFERIILSKRGEDYRTPFQIDRDRIIHSSEFRRLQGKTQVFLPGEYDYYRTRLTHSIEVSQIGRSICNYLNKKESFLDETFFIDSDLVEAACLSHDLGNPPFGHAGERTINKLMQTYGGFEGNAQTLRLLTEIFYRDNEGRKGMNPTRALIDGILKYKTFYKNLDNPLNHFIYNAQEKYIDFVFNGKKIPSEYKFGDNEKSINNLKSIECQIMDWADDTAYAINDLADSISGGFITLGKLKRWAEANKNNSNYEQEVLDELLTIVESERYKALLGSKVGDCICACKLVKVENFMSDKTNRYKYNLLVDKALVKRINIYKKISTDLVFKSPQLHQMEFKGNSMIKKIFDVLIENYLEGNDKNQMKLLVNFTDKIVRQAKTQNEKARIICDYISGMTDSFAIRTYKRLFESDFSSLVDLF